MNPQDQGPSKVSREATLDEYKQSLYFRSGTSEDGHTQGRPQQAATCQGQSIEHLGASMQFNGTSLLDIAAFELPDYPEYNPERFITFDGLTYGDVAAALHLSEHPLPDGMELDELRELVAKAVDTVGREAIRRLERRDRGLNLRMSSLSRNADKKTKAQINRLWAKHIRLLWGSKARDKQCRAYASRLIEAQRNAR